MDFDVSKENIQPLRGGRNVAQLGVALQAQSNEQYQQELLQQKEEFENSIRCYEGEDPLDNWYHFISWVEQSYPKHGHEGNLGALLEDCLSKFENDKRYVNDRRFCKLWIKYIDLQQNPLELYQMMHARGLCKGCADLYKAWSYYHEAAGDFKSADAVFGLGKSALAQPYDELFAAHQHMVMAAGQHVIKGVDHTHLNEKRHALTSLHTYRPGRVSSIRVSGAQAPALFPADHKQRNAPVPIYTDQGDSSAQSAAAAPVSILRAAKRQEATKENSLRPGPWTTVPNKRHLSSSAHKTPNFRILEDDGDVTSRGLQLPSTFHASTYEDYSNLNPPMFYPEPEDPTKVPMYPKREVYKEQGVEYSMEEIRARRYRPQVPQNRLSVTPVETQQAVLSILGECSPIVVHPEPMNEVSQQPLQVNMNVSNDHHLSMQQIQEREVYEVYRQSKEQHNQQELLCHSMNQDRSTYQQQQQPSPPPFQIYQSPGQPSFFQAGDGEQQSKVNQSKMGLQTVVSALVSPSQADASQENVTFSDLWRAGSNEDSVMMMAPRNVTKFSIYEESNIGMQAQMQPQMQPKGSAMKTPFKDLSADDLAETGSRGGLDAAAAAQPADSAKRLPIFEDDSSSSFGTEMTATPDHSCNTMMFNFNLNAMKVSTPLKPIGSPKDAKESCKQLFGGGEPEKVLSTILEETKSYGSSGSGGSTYKSTLNQTKINNNLGMISEEFNRNLEQNLMANAALRSSLGDLMDCDTHQSGPLTERVPLVPETEPLLNKIVPFEQAPSDPFRPSLINVLLSRVGFPGRHSYGYQVIPFPPRLSIRKDPVRLGRDKYYIDKQLGKGTYGTVYRAVNESNCTVALKYQKPANKWEFYICRELKARLVRHPLRDRFMDIHIGYYNDQASVLVSEYSPFGSLLDVKNAVKQKSSRSMKESLCMYFCIEMLKVVSAMHSAQIIHADVKPDNFLVQLAPDGSVTLQLIDFGCSIDMALFPPGTAFRRPVTTEDFICCEMKDDRPWTYHTDLFCVAATAHVLLFDKYIQMQKRDGHWAITTKLSRYMRLDLWNMFFSLLLNQQNGPADTEILQCMLTDALQKEADFPGDMRYLVNLLKNR